MTLLPTSAVRRRLGSAISRLGLRTRLLLVVVVPLAGVAVFAGLWAGSRLRSANEADDARARTELAISLADLLQDVSIEGASTASQLETIRLGPLATLLERSLATVRSAVDGDVAALTSRRGEIRRLTGRDGWARIAESLEPLDSSRKALASLAADAPGRRTARAATELIVDQSLARYRNAADVISGVLTEVADSPSARAHNAGAIFRAFAQIQEGRVRESVFVLQTSDREDWTTERGIELVVSATTDRNLLETLRSELDEEERAHLSAIATSPAERSWRSIRRSALIAAGLQNGTSDPISLLQGALVAQSRVTALEGLRESVEAELVGRAKDEASAAGRDFQIALVAALALTLLTVALSLLAVRPVARTLRTLSDRVRRIGAGDLTVEPVMASGGGEAAVLARAFDEMVGTLAALGRQVDALAEGRTDEPALSTPLPGRLGEALQRSVESLADMTTRLRGSEAFSRAIVETAAEALWTIDADLVITSANPAAAEMLRIPTADIVGRPCHDILHEVAARACVSGEVVELTNAELAVKAGDGTDVPVLVSTRVLPDLGQGPLVAVFARDISDRKLLERRLEHQALHDPLTGLPNRKSLLDHIERALRAARRSGTEVGLLFIDLDRFKPVNDALGHEAGDELLREVARRLAAELRPTDTVARLAGDEFVVVAEDVDSPVGLVVLGERLLEAVCSPVDIVGEPARISASIGIARGSGDGCTAAELLRDADAAMYLAKRAGRGRVEVFDDEMRAWIEERRDLEQALGTAITQGELRAHFQPIVNTSDGSVWGAELLARWDRKGFGAIPPSAFVAVAEESGLVVELGRWALGQACEVLAGWQRGSTPNGRSVSVNISGHHVVGGDLAHDVESALARSGADAASLVIEITESHLVDEDLRAGDVLQRLSEIGVRVALDDFGTGYSSLSTLRHLPFDVVKIDQSYVRRLGTDPHDTAIVSMVAALADALGLAVVAEGVETPSQLDVLARLGCPCAQGFLFAEALAPAALDRWIADRESALVGG